MQCISYECQSSKKKTWHENFSWILPWLCAGLIGVGEVRAESAVLPQNLDERITALEREVQLLKRQREVEFRSDFKGSGHVQ